MPRAVWITCFWPGLAQLWLRGQWRGLLIAASFAGLVNLGLAATLVWPQWWPAPWCQAMWLGLGVSWLVMGIRSYGLVASFRDLLTINEQQVSPASQKNDYYVEAQAQYLKQNWFEAEQCLTKAISVNAYDVDALLMLIALYRHTGRTNEARQVLQHVATLERTDKWNWELAREKALLDSFDLDSHEENFDPATLAATGNQPLQRAA